MVSHRCHILGKLGRYQEAIDTLDLALSVGSPVDVEVRFLKATLLELMDRLG